MVGAARQQRPRVCAEDQCVHVVALWKAAAARLPVVAVICGDVESGAGGRIERAPHLWIGQQRANRRLVWDAGARQGMSRRRRKQPVNNAVGGAGVDEVGAERIDREAEYPAAVLRAERLPGRVLWRVTACQQHADHQQWRYEQPTRQPRLPATTLRRLAPLALARHVSSTSCGLRQPRARPAAPLHGKISSSWPSPRSRARA